MNDFDPVDIRQVAYPITELMESEIIGLSVKSITLQRRKERFLGHAEACRRIRKRLHRIIYVSVPVAAKKLGISESELLQEARIAGLALHRNSSRLYVLRTDFFPRARQLLYPHKSAIKIFVQMLNRSTDLLQKGFNDEQR